MDKKIPRKIAGEFVESFVTKSGNCQRYPQGLYVTKSYWQEYQLTQE